MMTGARLVAPEGYKNLSNNTIYHFLQNNAQANRVRLVEFIDNCNNIDAVLISFSSIEFEEALETGLIVEAGTSDTFPPWLEPIKGVAIAELERRRISIKETYSQKVDRRFFAIAELIENIHGVLASENPDAIINAHAKSQRPQQNSHRLRLWFYTYIVFGQNRWSLLPPLYRIGGWDRDGPMRRKKLGRPSSRGKSAGYRCTPEMREKILKGYFTHKAIQKTAYSIYSDILCKEFGCVPIKKGKSFEFFQPAGTPYPSENQVRYVIKKTLSDRERSIDVRGVNMTRAISGSTGSFSERLTNVNQCVEFDGFYITEKLSGISEGTAVDSFCVVRAVCVLSGLIVGIGFSEGKEKKKAYEMCLFCMASPKVKYCELFGISIKPEDWPCEGLAGNVVFDRGPGANYGSEPQISWLGTFEVTPVHSGQSKATVESSHRRNKKNLDQTTYFHSRMNFVEMARREIQQVVYHNSSSDAGGRMEDDMILAGVKHNPLGVWNYWDNKGRNSGICIEFVTAARQFLSLQPATIKRDAVYLFGRKYRSKELVGTGIFDRVARGCEISTIVFVLTMCVRHIWVEVAGVLYELDIMRTQRTNDGLVDISLRDLQLINTIRREGAATLRDERPAVQAYYLNMLKEQTGIDPSKGAYFLGRPFKGAAAKRDAADYRFAMGTSR